MSHSPSTMRRVAVSVAADGDPGGTLVASAIKVVLALHVTASMHGRVDNALPASGDVRRLAEVWLLSVMTQGAIEPS